MARDAAKALPRELHSGQGLTLEGLAQIPLSTTRRAEFDRTGAPLKTLASAPGLLGLPQQLLKIFWQTNQKEKSQIGRGIRNELHERKHGRKTKRRKGSEVR